MGILTTEASVCVCFECINVHTHSIGLCVCFLNTLMYTTLASLVCACVLNACIYSHTRFAHVCVCVE